MSEEKKRDIKKVSRTCVVCGKTFLASAHRNRQHCSAECYHVSWYSKNGEAARAYQSLHLVELCETSDGYAKFREARRISRRRAYEKKHPGCKHYRPAKSRRIPDWAVKGQEILDRRSVFLNGNVSDEHVVAANAACIEQHKKENSNPRRVKTIFRSR